MKKVVSFNYLVNFTLIFLVYVVTARIGPSIATQFYASAVWIPSGIALTSILLLGYRYWAAIALGEFIVNWYFTPLPADVSLFMTIGDTAETLLAVYVLKHFGFKTSFNHLKDVILLIIVAVISTLISATIGVSSLYFKGIITASQYILTWKTWWVANTLSILILPPLILSWFIKPKFQFKLTRIFEVILFVLIIFGVDLIIFHNILNSLIDSSSSTYLIFPPLIWSALRFGMRGTATTIFVITAISIIETANGLGPFISNNLAFSLLSLQTYIGIMAATITILAVVESERKLLELRKDEFISMASHELKTPITSVKAYSQVLLKIPFKNNYTVIKSYLNKMDLQINNMTHLINGLLDLSKIQSNSFGMNKKVFSLDKLLYEIIEDMRVMCNARNLIFKNSSGKSLDIYADREYISQVLINLISNAIKYSPGDSKVIVRIKLINKGFVEVSVKDFGIGITEEDKDKIFDKYFRVDSIKRRTISGLGIGLYLSDQILKRHEGSLSVMSKKGRGSKFIFVLPVAKNNVSHG